MVLSDFSIKRPVVATVLSMLLVVFGAVAMMQLPIREAPDIERPVVSINVTYPGRVRGDCGNQSRSGFGRPDQWG